MNIGESIKLAQDKGFILPGQRAWIQANNREQLVRDAAMITAPNSGVPVEYTAYLDPLVIEILTAPRNAREIYPEVKKGDWATSYSKFQLDEYTGQTQPYTDYGNAGQSDVNPTFPSRQQYIFQTTIQYGDYEQAVTSMAKINLAARKQQAAARTIDIDSNKFYLLGVAGREIYGLLNEPNLPPALTPAGTTPSWDSKDTKAIYNDVLALYESLVEKSQGLINIDSDLVLALPPSRMVLLGKATDFNVSVQDMLDKYFRNKLKFVSLPELYSATAGNTILMTARDIIGTPTAQFGFSEKMRMGRVIPELSSFKQKIVGTTYGCILYRPFGVATMIGV